MKHLTVFALALAATLGAACGKSQEPAAQAATASAAPALPPAGEGRLVEITATNDGYKPKVVEAKQGEKLILRFTRKTPSGCLAEIVFPGLNIKKDLPVDKPVDIAVTADKPGKIPFQCGMAMVFGSVNVT